ncbi:dihydrofolate reductase [Oryzobacter telluris]|uniref:dihydrofolate reductase n=1 Tax=Oryzobacter telluris TaxID=3149179 RepID=UPI00370DC669
MTTISLIAAVARNGVIGLDGGMPWHLPEELAHFKATTMGHTLVMGRRTFDSIGRALPGRRTVVVTRDASWHHPGVETAHSFPEAIALSGPADEVFVAGGAQVYAEALPFAHRLVLTEVDAEPEGDTWFPRWDRSQWHETSREAHDGWSRVVYDRG